MAGRNASICMIVSTSSPHTGSPVVCRCTDTKADKMFLNMLQNIFPLISMGVDKMLFPMGNVALQIKHFGDFTLWCTGINQKI